MAVLTSKQPVEKITMANDFINFLISPQTQQDIADYGKDKYGKSLFTPMSVSDQQPLQDMSVILPPRLRQSDCSRHTMQEALPLHFPNWRRALKKHTRTPMSSSSMGEALLSSIK